MTKVTLNVALILLIFQGGAKAACSCKCVNGSVKLICSETPKFSPMCAPKVCAKKQLTFKPAKPRFVPTPPVVNMMNCQQRRVLDPSTNKLIWRTICRPENSFQY